MLLHHKTTAGCRLLTSQIYHPRPTSPEPSSSAPVALKGRAAELVGSEVATQLSGMERQLKRMQVGRAAHSFALKHPLAQRLHGWYFAHGGRQKALAVDAPTPLFNNIKPRRMQEPIHFH